MNTSPQIDQLAAALCQFQLKIKPLKKKATAEKAGEFFAYAPIDDILKHVRQRLAERDLYIMQTVTGDIGVTTRLLWVDPNQATDFLNDKQMFPTIDPQWIEDTALVSVKGSMEDKGAAITQLRRYSLITLLGLPTVDAAPAVNSSGSFAQEIVRLRQQVVEQSPLSPEVVEAVVKTMRMGGGDTPEAFMLRLLSQWQDNIHSPGSAF